MDSRVVLAFLLSGLVSAVLAFRLLRSNRTPLEKVAFCLVLLLPFIGPIFYLFLNHDVPSQHPFLRNDGPRGDYTHRMIGIQSEQNRPGGRSPEEPNKQDG